MFLCKLIEESEDFEVENGSYSIFIFYRSWKRLANVHYKRNFFLHKGIYVQNLNQFIVTDLKNTMKYLAKGNQSR